MKTKRLNKNVHDQRPDPRRKRFAFPLLLILATVGLLVACGLPSLAVTPAAPPTSQSGLPSLAVTPSALPAGKSVLPDDPLAAIIQALKAEINATPFRETVTIDNGGEPLKITAEFESLQRVLLVTPSGSYKMVDGKYYQKQGDVWQDYPDGATIMAGFLGMGDEATVDAFIATIQTANRLNDETIAGQVTRHYEYTYTNDQSGVQSQGTVQLWVTEATGLPLKQVAASETAGYTATATTIFEYDPSIRVNAP